MKTQKGIVFENTSSYSIFLTEDGRFQKGIPIRSSALVGEEVSFRPYVAMIKTKPSVKSAWMAPLVAAVAIVLMFFSVLLPAQSKVSAFVQVDFNPSIELGIDEKGDVQQFRGLNEDGTALKREISFWKGKSLTRVLTTIVDHSIVTTQNEKQLEFTTIYKEDISQKSLEKLIRTAIAESTRSLEIESVQMNEASVEDRAKANEKGVSVDAYKQQKEQKEIIKEKTKKQPTKLKVKEQKKNQKQTEKEHKKENKKEFNKELKKEHKHKQKMIKKQENGLQKNNNKHKNQYSLKQQKAKNPGYKGSMKENGKEKDYGRKKNSDKAQDEDGNKGRDKVINKKD